MKPQLLLVQTVYSSTQLCWFTQVASAAELVSLGGLKFLRIMSWQLLVRVFYIYLYVHVGSFFGAFSIETDTSDCAVTTFVS